MASSLLSTRSVFAIALGATLGVAAPAHAGGDGRLLIIYDGAFQAQVQAYRDWKVANDPGLDAVDLVDAATTGAAPIDAGDIGAYVDSYAAAHADFAYLLLVGDETTVPPTMEPDATNPPATIPSDDAYADLDGDDLPDVAVGRIIPYGPATLQFVRATNLGNQFAKIEAQHQRAITDPVYDKLLLAVDFVDDVVAAKATVGSVQYVASGVATAGAAGNAYKIKYALKAGTVLNVVTDAAARTITVNLGTYPGGGSSSTAVAVATAINSHAVARTWVTATPTPGYELVIQPAIGWVSLAGGVSADGAPDLPLVEGAEQAALHLEGMLKTVTRAFRSTALTDSGAVLVGGAVPTYIDTTATRRIVDTYPELAYTGGFDWAADTGTVTGAIGGGVETVVYMGHGGAAAWAAPHLGVTDVAGLTNTVHPVVFNFACSTGNYVGNDSLAEALLQSPYAGASAVFAATSPVSSAGGLRLEDYVDGLVDSIDDSYQLDVSHTGQDLHRIGDRLVYLKTFLAARAAGIRGLHDHLHQFTLFGDPSMRYRPFQ